METMDDAGKLISHLILDIFYRRWAKRDHEGRYRIIGRVDDVINVSGHRIGTAEIEDAINQHPNVVESAVVGFPHAIKGHGIFAYLVTRNEV
jgi:acetyl-CoA synthetase